jgi:iron complex outermembrane receptor protein
MSLNHSIRSAPRGRDLARSAIVFLTASSTLTLAAAAQAADASGPILAANASASAATVEDVVVTATRQSTKLQQTPVAVTAIGGDQIVAQNVVTTRDLAGQTPGVTIQRSGITPLTQVFFIRGIGDSDPIFDPNVAVYVDDIYLPRAINGMTDLSDIQRIEVLRGPQGTLFGENADAGAIRYITKTPSDTLQGSFDIGGGTYNAFNTHGYVTGPLIAGLLDASLAIAHDQHDGYTWDPTIHQHVNNQDTTGARVKLLATPRADLTVQLTVDGTEDKSGSGYYAALRPIVGGTLQSPVYGTYNPTLSYASQPPTNNSWSAGAALRIAYVVNPNLTFTSITGFRGFAQDPVNYNNDGQPLVPYSNANPIPVSISDNFIVYREHETTQEFQLQGKYDRFDFTSGLYFLNEDFSSNRIGYVVSPTAATPALAYPEDQIGDTQTTNYAAYAQGDYHITSKLIATLGLRYTIEKRVFNFQGVYDTLAGVYIPPVVGASTATPGGYAAANDFTYQGAKTWYSLTPKYGLSYQLQPTIFGYASVSKGFDAGGFNNRASSLATALPYNQENVTTYEAGLKTDWLEHRLRINLTGFYNDYQGLQQTASVISPVTNGLVSVRSNAGAAHTEGFELETALQPTDGLKLTANASYLSTRFDSFPNAGSSVVNGKTVVVGATGNQLPFSPVWQLYGAADYRIPIQGRGDLRIGADITYETCYFSDVFNYAQGKVSDQGFADAYVSFAPKHSPWLFTLTARNLANRLALQSITWGGTPNLWEGPVNPPRTVFFKIAYAH